MSPTGSGKTRGPLQGKARADSVDARVARDRTAKSQSIISGKSRFQRVQLIYHPMERVEPFSVVRIWFCDGCGDRVDELVLALHRFRENITKAYILAAEIAVPLSNRIAT